jgi:hypothetical protein
MVTLPELSQVIPIQLMQGLMPTLEERRDWLWLSRLAFHRRRASASVLLLPNGEVGEEVCSAKAKKEEKLNMWSKNRMWRKKEKNGLSSKDVVMVCFSRDIGYGFLW